MESLSNEDVEVLKFPGLNMPIREVQLVELDILLEVDRICQKHQVSYQLFSGTLLGAVRHGGFIPWDDDIDICMTREEYERFLEVARRELSKEYFLQNYEDAPECPFHFTKIRRSGSVFRTLGTKKAQFHTGIWIDIFPMDNVELETSEGLKHRRDCQRAFVLTTSMDASRCAYSRNGLIVILRYILHYCTKLWPKQCWHAWAEKTFQRFRHRTIPYRACLPNGLPPREVERFKMLQEDFTNTMPMLFEGHAFPVPVRYREILTQNYGDYMALPAFGDRIPGHCAIEIKLSSE